MRGSAELVRKKSLLPLKKSYSTSLILHPKESSLKSSSNTKTKTSNGSLGEKCSNCHRSFRDSEHLAKHKRGALCRRLVQRVARQNRKLATKFDKPKSASLSSAVGSRKKPQPSRPVLATHKPYQCSVCGARFLDKVNVELHCERHHNANRHLWVEVARGHDAQAVAPSSTLDTNNISSIVEGNVGACTSRASFVLTPDNTLADVVSNSNHVSPPRLMPLDRVKCTECNAFFHSEVQLHEHKKVSHQTIPNCVESPSSHVLFHQSSPATVLNRNIGTLSNSNASCQQYLGHNVGSIDTSITNLSLNQPILTPGYIFPAPPTYYSHDPNSSMQQNIVHPHVSYMQPQHAVHPHVLHHQAEMQPHEPQQELPPQQHPEQVHGEPHSHMQHQPPPPHLHSQDLLLSLQQPTPAQLPLPLHNPILGGHPTHHSAISSQSYPSPVLIDSPPSHLTSSTVMVSSELASLVYSNASNSVPGDRLGTSVLPSSSSNDSVSSSLTNGNLICTSVTTVPMSSAFGVSSPSSSRASSTGKPLEKPDATVNTKWNMCGDCGLKFIDLMNLELHVEKKHPLLAILGSVDFKDGTVCHKTGTSITKNHSRSGVSSRSLTKDIKIPQRHLCTICHHTSISLSPMVDHVMSMHNLTGKPMIDAIRSEEGTSEYGSTKSSFSAPFSKENSSFSDVASTTVAVKSSKLIPGKDGGKVQDPSLPLGEDSCYLCQANFNSSAELIRHRIKDKKHICGMCFYVTCSRKVLTAHLKTEHDLSDVSGSSTAVLSDLKKQLSCWRCNVTFQKTSDFINHLKCHGSLSGRCEKCGKQDYNIANILIHMTTLHPDYINRVSITVTGKGKMSTCLYLQTLAGDLLDASCLESRGKSDSQNNEEQTTGTSKSQSSNNKNRKRSVSADNGSSSSENKTSRAKDDDDRRTYACSQCLISLYGTTSLESHLKQHEGSGSSGLLPGLANIKRSPSEERQSPETASSTRYSDRSRKSSKSSKQTRGITKSKGKAFDPQKVGLQSLPLTCGFKCEECGLTKDSSNVLVSHIQKVHISGNLIHMVNEKKGAVKEYPIYIVTPISST
ncbi:Zinc finger C2H2-type [Trinorchestia longiramus]|nr:Zinc finger C2H2-type [Trinorchestia longiramus]